MTREENVRRHKEKNVERTKYEKEESFKKNYKKPNGYNQNVFVLIRGLENETLTGHAERQKKEESASIRFKRFLKTLDKLNAKQGQIMIVNWL